MIKKSWLTPVTGSPTFIQESNKKFVKQALSYWLKYMYAPSGQKWKGLV